MATTGGFTVRCEQGHTMTVTDGPLFATCLEHEQSGSRGPLVLKCDECPECEQDAAENEAFHDGMEEGWGNVFTDAVVMCEIGHTMFVEHGDPLYHIFKGNRERGGHRKATCEECPVCQLIKMTVEVWVIRHAIFGD